MIGKLYITTNSDIEKLQNVSALVAEAIDNNIANDAASRNALNKVLAALSKVTGEAGKVKQSPDETIAPAAEDGMRTPEDQEMDESIMATEADIKVENHDDEDVIEGVTQGNDSLVEELLEDDDDL